MARAQALAGRDGGADGQATVPVWREQASLAQARGQADEAEAALRRAYDGGLIVQSGARPQFGDREAGHEAPEYAAVNRCLKPLRIASMGLQKGGRGPRFDRAASEAWLARLD